MGLYTAGGARITKAGFPASPVQDRLMTVTERIYATRRYATPRHVKEWFAARLQPASADRVGPVGIRRIGADADPDSLAIRMLPKLGLTAKHQGTKIGRAEIRAPSPSPTRMPLPAPSSPASAAPAPISAGLLLVRPTADA